MPGTATAHLRPDTAGSLYFACGCVDCCCVVSTLRSSLHSLWSLHSTLLYTPLSLHRDCCGLLWTEAGRREGLVVGVSLPVVPCGSLCSPYTLPAPAPAPARSSVNGQSSQPQYLNTTILNHYINFN